LLKKGVRFMNEALYLLCLGRSLEAIKGQRRSKAELVMITTEGLHIAGDSDKGASVEGEEGSGEGHWKGL